MSHSWCSYFIWNGAWTSLSLRYIVNLSILWFHCDLVIWGLITETSSNTPKSKIWLRFILIPHINCRICRIETEPRGICLALPLSHKPPKCDENPTTMSKPRRLEWAPSAGHCPLSQGPHLLLQAVPLYSCIRCTGQHTHAHVLWTTRPSKKLP